MFTTIRTQLLVLAILPSLLIALTLGIYLSYSRFQDLESYTDTRGYALLQQLTVNAAYAMRTNNIELLQAISNASLEEKGVRSVSFVNNQYQEIIHSGPILSSKIIPQSQLNNTVMMKWTNENIVTFSSPVYSNPLTSSINIDNITVQNSLIGWVIVEYNQESVVIKKHQYLLIQSLLIIAAMLVAGTLSSWLFRRLLNDINTINNSIKRIKEGDSINSIQVNSSKEIRMLANNIDDMAQHLNNEMDELRHNVKISTNDLKETIETIEIQNIELNLARKEALTASKIKSEFLANTSHEIRTPLNGILGFTKILSKTALSKQQAEYVDTIQKSSENLLAIMNDILDFSKIEAGKLELEDVPFNLRTVFDECISLFAPHAYDKGIEIVLMIYQDVPVHLMGDAMRIKQIVSNLLSNAVKFTENGTIAVRVSLDEQVNNNIHLLISVSDTGIGMTALQQKEIFQSFTQANSSISREYGGTGLGLAIVKKLVQLMHDDIKVESAPNEGSTFSFTLKTRLSDVQNVSTDSVFKGKSILVIEQHELAHLALKHLLIAWQINPISANNIEQAAQIFKEHHLDAIIFAINPGQTSNTILIDITRLAGFKFPILVLTPDIHDTSLIGLKTANVSVAFKPVTEKRLHNSLLDLIVPKTASLFTPSSLPIKNRDNLHVLAVDDHEANLKLLNVLLSDLNISVICANNGKEAIGICEQHHFDIIFMDIQMPIMNGVTATTIIRDSSSLNKNTPIIAITAHALADEKDALLKAGMNDYLSKPINEEQLKIIIKKWCVKPDNNTNIFSIIDIELCYKLANYKADLAIDMFEMLLINLEDEIEYIKQHLENKNYSLLLEIVHKLHGACSYTGVPELKQATYNFENAIKNSKHEEFPELFLKLKIIANKLMEWNKYHKLENYLQSAK